MARARSFLSSAALSPALGLLCAVVKHAQDLRQGADAGGRCRVIATIAIASWLLVLDLFLQRAQERVEVFAAKIHTQVNGGQINRLPITVLLLRCPRSRSHGARISAVPSLRCLGSRVPIRVVQVSPRIARSQSPQLRVLLGLPRASLRVQAVRLQLRFCLAPLAPRGLNLGR